ncbi:MAG TPA: IgGFc-binding protein [Kofleriaceae bacterium]|nr:IgGFc-binding protein [Kofleriaceae bacterium]
MKRIALLLLYVCACGGGKGTHPDASPGGADAAMECTAEGQTRCLGATYETCMNGSWNVTQQCAMSCDSALGCVACSPGIDYCVGNDVHSCTAQGDDGGVTMTCPSNQTCSSGKCVDPCADAAANRSYIGCEYWAVDLDNAFEVFGVPDQLFGCLLFSADAKQYTNTKVCFANAGGGTTAGVCDEPGDACPSGFTCQSKTVCGLDAQHSPFAIVVSNPQSKAVDVTITDGAGKTSTQSVPAGQVKSLFPTQLGLADQSLDWTMQGKKAYKISSTMPIVAYQFNPLDNVGVFSNDASLLIPKTTFDVEYIALTYDTLTRRTGTNDYNGYVAIVAPQDDTMITVTPSADVRASTTGGGGVITKGTATTFTLAAFDVLELEAVGAATAGIDGPDLSGTVIQSADTKTFGVFAGTEATVIPTDAPNGVTGSACCADHLEEMMFPTSTWGKKFAIARSQVRLTQKPENDVLRVLAQKAGTTVTFDPAPVKGTCGTLGVGEFCEVEISVDTAITASEPILIGHYLKSVEFQSGGQIIGSGDPSLAIAVPSEQFRGNYTILVPSQYMNNYVSIVVPTGSTASIDGSDVTSQLTAFGSNMFKGGRISVAAGAHAITCNGAGCGIEVYGYSDAVSYMFAGGLDLRQIVVN